MTNTNMTTHTQSAIKRGNASKQVKATFERFSHEPMVHNGLMTTSIISPVDVPMKVCPTVEVEESIGVDTRFAMENVHALLKVFDEVCASYGVSTWWRSNNGDYAIGHRKFMKIDFSAPLIANMFTYVVEVYNEEQPTLLHFNWLDNILRNSRFGFLCTKELTAEFLQGIVEHGDAIDYYDVHFNKYISPQMFSTVKSAVNDLVSGFSAFSSGMADFASTSGSLKSLVESITDGITNIMQLTQVYIEKLKQIIKVMLVVGLVAAMYKVFGAKSILAALIGVVVQNGFKELYDYMMNFLTVDNDYNGEPLQGEPDEYGIYPEERRLMNDAMFYVPPAQPTATNGLQPNPSYLQYVAERERHNAQMSKQTGETTFSIIDGRVKENPYFLRYAGERNPANIIGYENGRTIYKTDLKDAQHHAIDDVNGDAYYQRSRPVQMNKQGQMVNLPYFKSRLEQHPVLRKQYLKLLEKHYKHGYEDDLELDWLWNRATPGYKILLCQMKPMCTMQQYMSRVLNSDVPTTIHYDASRNQEWGGMLCVGTTRIVCEQQYKTKAAVRQHLFAAHAGNKTLILEAVLGEIDGRKCSKTEADNFPPFSHEDRLARQYATARIRKQAGPEIISALGLKEMAAMSTIMVFLRNLSSMPRTFGSLLGFLPACITAFLIEKTPKLASLIGITMGQWGPEYANMKRHLEERKIAPSTRFYKDCLQYGERAGAKLANFIEHAWYTKAYEFHARYMQIMREGLTDIQALEEGIRPINFAIVGPDSQIGKTVAAANIGATLGTHYQHLVMGRTYARPISTPITRRIHGDYCENFTPDTIVCAYEDFTREPNDEKCCAIMNEISDVCDGIFMPNFAFGNKGTKFQPPVVYYTSNVPNLAPLNDRTGKPFMTRFQNTVFRAELRDTFKYHNAQGMECVGTKQNWKHCLKDAADKSLSPHLKYVQLLYDQKTGMQSNGPSFNTIDLIKHLQARMEQITQQMKNMSIPDEYLAQFGIELQPREEKEDPEDYSKYVLLAGVVAAAIGMIVKVYGSVTKQIEPQYATKPRVVRKEPKRVTAMRKQLYNGNGLAANHATEIQRVHANMCMIAVENGDNSQIQHALFIDGRTILVNQHFVDAMPDEDAPVTLSFGLSTVTSLPYRKYNFEFVKLGNDLALMKLENPVRSVKSLHRMLSFDYTISRQKGYLLAISHYDECQLYSNMKGQFDDEHEAFPVIAYYGQTTEGDCGRPILTLNEYGALTIAGIHCGDSESLCFSATIPEFELEEVTIIAPQTKTTEVSVTMHGFENLGRVKNGVSANCRSVLKQTPYRPVGSTIMRSILKPERLYKGEAAFGELIPPPTREVFNFGRAAAIDTFAVSWSGERRMLSYEEVYDLIDWSKASGWGYKARDEYRRDGKFTPEFIKECDEYLQSLYDGSYESVTFASNLKDETLTIEKAQRKTRVFEVQGFKNIVVHMRLSGAFHKYMVETYGRTPSVCGVNVDSPQWDKMLKRFKKRGYNYLDVDFSAFDKHCAAFMMDIYNAVLDQFYGNKDVARTRIEANMFNGAVIVQDNIYWRFQGNPSGRHGTTDLNTITHLALMAMCYHMIYPSHTVGDFQRSVKSIIYGDDGVHAIASDVPEYNFRNIRKCMAELGWVVTPGDKREDMDFDYMAFEELTFLKRRFCFSEELKMWVPYLPLKEVMQQLEYCRDVSANGLSALVSSVAYHYFWRGNRSRGPYAPCADDMTYNEWSKYVSDILGVEVPTWEKLKYDMITSTQLDYDFHKHANSRAIAFADLGNTSVNETIHLRSRFTE